MAKKSADQWFDEYSVCHQNKTNKKIHWVCVPAIAFSLLALLWNAPTPGFMHQIPYLNWGTLLIFVSLLYYLRLSPPLAIGMLLFSVVEIAFILFFEQSRIMPLWQFALAIFVVAWIGQAIGHAIEGKKPSFFADLIYLLIGPIWLLSAIYRKLGIAY